MKKDYIEEHIIKVLGLKLSLAMQTTRVGHFATAPASPPVALPSSIAVNRVSASAAPDLSH